MKMYSGIIKLVCLFVVAPIVIWKFALGNTINLYKEKQKVEEVNLNLPATPQASIQATAPVASEPLLSNGKLLKVLADTLTAGQVEVLSYIPEIIDAEDSYKLYCGKLVLSGRYINLVKIVSAIENTNLPVRIASTTFEYDRKKRNAPKAISLCLLIEQIEHL